MHDRHLTRIEVENFKRFAGLNVELSALNLLVGPNNSGKSTLLQAFLLFDACYRSLLIEDKSGDLRFANRTFAPEEFAVVPVADPLDLWLDRRTRHGKEAVPLRVAAEFASGARYEFQIRISHNRFNVQAGRDNPPPLAPRQFGIAFVPPYVGFWPKEERRTPVALRELRAQGQLSAVIRNLLLDLRADAQGWGRFRALLAEVFPEVDLHEPRFNEQLDRYIHSTYRDVPAERRPGGDVVFDLFSAGSGFHQFVQILGAIASEGATTILLDEPDAHLFSRLQSRLYGVLSAVVEQGLQIVAASHSPELIAACDPQRIITFANGTPRRLQVRAEVSGVARALGAFENLGLLLIDAHERVVVVEDAADEKYLRWWLDQLLPADVRRRLHGRLVFLHTHGRPQPTAVNLVLDALERTFSEERRLRVRAFVVADRDYRLDEELLAEREKLAGRSFERQRWHVWSRMEIENYLLHADVLLRYLVAQAEAATRAGPLFRPAPAELQAMIEEAVEASRDAVRAKLIDAFERRHRDWQASTCLQHAEELLARVWQGDERLTWCDAKDVVLPALRRELHARFGLSLSDRELIGTFQTDDAARELRDLAGALAGFVLSG